MSNGEEKQVWFSVSDISKMLGIPERTIKYYIQIGKGPKAYKIGRHIRVRQEDFDLWTKQSTVEEHNTHPRQRTEK